MSTIVENTIQDFSEFNPENLIFCDPIARDIPQSDEDKTKGLKPQQYFQSDIQYEYPSGETNDLIVVTPHLFTFGPQKKVDQNGKISFQMCLKLGKNGTDYTDEEQAFVDFLDTFTNIAEDAMFEMRGQVRKAAKWKTKDKMNMKDPVYRPVDKESGEIRTDVSPSLYVKLIATNKVRGARGKNGETGHWRSITGFEGVDGTEYEFAIEQEDGSPGDLLDQRGHATCALKFSHVYIGDKPSLQIKLLQVQFEPQEMTKRCYLPTVKRTNKSTRAMLGDDEKEDDPEINSDEEDPDELTF